MRIDLHTHSIYSDGADTPERMVARAKAIGLDGFALTDHDSVSGWKRTIEAGKRLGLIVVPGEEISLRTSPKGKKCGEILGLFLNEEIKPHRITDAWEVIDKIKEQDGISAIPHVYNPFWWRNNGIKVIEAAAKKHRKVDAIEVMNGKNTVGSNNRSNAYAIKHKYAKIAGSDAHLAREIGNAYTICETNDIEEFRKLIKKKKTFVLGTQRRLPGLIKDMAKCKTLRLLKFLRK